MVVGINIFKLLHSASNRKIMHFLVLVFEIFKVRMFMNLWLFFSILFRLSRVFLLYELLKRNSFHVYIQNCTLLCAYICKFFQYYYSVFFCFDYLFSIPNLKKKLILYLIIWICIWVVYKKTIFPLGSKTYYLVTHRLIYWIFKANT